MELCLETKKHIHLSKSKAEAQLRSLKQKSEYSGKVYSCIYCMGWHIGRRKINAR